MSSIHSLILAPGDSTAIRYRRLVCLHVESNASREKSRQASQCPFRMRILAQEACL